MHGEPEPNGKIAQKVYKKSKFRFGRWILLLYNYISWVQLTW